MGSIFENSVEEENRRRRKKRNKTILFFGLIGAGVLIGIVVIVCFSYYYAHRSFSGYDVVNEQARKDSNGVSYLPFHGDLLKYSRDGIALIDDSGETLWNGGYEMEQPVVDIRGNYVLVADIGAKMFYVYNGEDQGVGIETTLPIGKAKICEDGRAAVLLQDEDSDVISIYDPYSTAEQLKVEVPTNVLDDGFPLDFAISPDGNSLVIAYIVVQNGTMENKVCFYNFTEVGQDQNTLVGGKSYETKMISHIGFVSDDKAAIFFEDGFALFENMKKPEQVFEKIFEDEIKSADHDDENIVVITGTAGSTDDQKLYLYNLRGKEELAEKISCRYSDFVMSGGEIIFTDAQSCYIIRKNGSEKFSFDFGKGFDYFLPAAGDERYYYIDEASIQQIKISG